MHHRSTFLDNGLGHIQCQVHLEPAGTSWKQALGTLAHSHTIQVSIISPSLKEKTNANPLKWMYSFNRLLYQL